MSETTPNTQGSDLVNKLQVAGITALGVILAAGVSAAVSFFVSDNTVKLELERLRTEESLEKARIFQELVNTASKAEDPTYALLALWKVYPDDEKLIVTTALMNPTPQTIGTLHALGIAEQLQEYEATIKALMVNAERELRQDFYSSYMDISPQAVFEVMYETMVRSGGQEGDLLDLKNFLLSHENFLPSLETRIAGDDRVQDDMRLRTRIASGLYEIGPAPFAALLKEAETDPAFFGQLARHIAERVSGLQRADQDRLAELALGSIEAARKSPEQARNLSGSLSLFESIAAEIGLSDDRAQRFTAAMSDIYLRNAHAGRPEIWYLSALHRHAPDIGAVHRLYLATVACADEARKGAGSSFYHGFPDRELALDDWETGITYDAARAAALERLGAFGEDCTPWIS